MVQTTWIVILSDYVILGLGTAMYGDCAGQSRAEPKQHCKVTYISTAHFSNYLLAEFAFR